MPSGMTMRSDEKPCKVCAAFRNWKPPATSTAKSRIRQFSGYILSEREEDFVYWIVT